MSSVTFDGSIWPWKLSTDTMTEVIVVWVLVVMSMTVLSAVTMHHFYRLFPLRRRDVQLVVGVVAMILLDFLIVEPLHLLCGAYAPSVDIAHVLYLTLSAISYHGLMHSILLRVWILYFDTKWLWICCLRSDECTEWKHHILDPLSLSPSHSPSPSDTVTMHKASTSMTIGNGTESLKTSKIHKDTESKSKSKSTATEREEKELAEEEIHSLHPHDQHLNESTNCAPAHISWFIRHRSSYGTVFYAVRFCVVSGLILIAAHLSALCLLRGTDRAVTLYLIDGVPVLLIYSLWIAMPEIKDYGTMSGRVFWRCLLILVAVTGSLQMAIKVMVTASKGMESDDAMNSALSILSVAIRFCTDFGATLCLLWCPRYIRCRDALRLEAQPVITLDDGDGVRVNSMSFQIEMTGSNGNGNDNGGGTHSVDNVDAGCTPKGDEMQCRRQQTQQAVLALFASSSSTTLLLRQCARECSVQNVFAIMELLQFRDYCMKQQQFIEEERMRRKKTAKLRYQRKRHSIHKRKRRRTQRLSMVNAEKESHDLSEDELIQHQIAQKEPIETAVTSSPDIEDDHEASYGGDDEEEEAVYGDGDGAERERIDIAEWLHIPKSSLIHRPFIVHSRLKRIEQLEAIIIALCLKYVDRGSVFSVDLPDDVVQSVMDSVQRMKDKHSARRQRGRRGRGRTGSGTGHHRGDRSSELMAMDTPSPSQTPDSPISGQSPLPMLEGGVSQNASKWYPEFYEDELPAFFDSVIDCILRTLSDSLRRLRHKEYLEKLRKRPVNGRSHTLNDVNVNAQ